MGCFNGCCDKKLLKGKQSCLRQDSTRDQLNLILSYLTPGEIPRALVGALFTCKRTSIAMMVADECMP